MPTYTVGYFVGSLSSRSINRILSKALIRLAPDELEFLEIPIKDLPPLQPRLRRGLSTGGHRLEGDDRDGRRGAVRLSRIQPVHSGCPEECHRLGVETVGPEFVRSRADRSDRRIDRRHRHRGRPAEPARGDGVLQRPVDDRPPEAYIHYTPEVFGDDGTVHNESTEAFLRNYMSEFRDHIVRVLTVLPR